MNKSQEINTKTISGAFCNRDEVIHPDLDAELPSCQVCQETQNWDGVTQGVSHPGCFDGDEKYLQKCERVSDICTTDIQVN